MLPMDKIAYKPLVLDPADNELHGLDLGRSSSAGCNSDSDLSDSELPEEEDDDEEPDDEDDHNHNMGDVRGRFVSFSRNSHHAALRNYKGDSCPRTSRLIFGCLAATVILVLLVRSFNTGDEDKHQPAASFASLKSAPPQSIQITTAPQSSDLSLISSINQHGLPSSSSAHATKPTQATLRAIQTGGGNLRPFYDNYLTSVINESGLDALDDLSLPKDHYSTSTTFENNAKKTPWWTVKPRNNYITLSNYIRAMKSFDYNNSVTLTTQASIGFLHHAVELCKRWDGPISVAVFAPVQSAAITLIKFMRQCLPVPLSACIRDKITWHLVYPMQDQYQLMNSINANEPGFPKHWLDTRKYPLFALQDQCPKFAGPEPVDLVRQFEANLKKLSQEASDQNKQPPLLYPINVLRNTARLAASTKYVLASDIELYPSVNLVSMFVNFIRNHNITYEFNHINKYIFTLPIFEIKSHVEPPKDKRELVKLYKKGDAVFFHKYVCDLCQSFPNRSNWLHTDQSASGATSFTADDELQIFGMTIRDRARDQWEPIFIGTNDEPLYDDRLTWDGRRDKMGQMVEMCLEGYYLLILDNAFLVHAPGIKRIDKNDNNKRFKYMLENNAIYTSYIEELRKRYAKSERIEIC